MLEVLDCSYNEIIDLDKLHNNLLDYFFNDIIKKINNN